MLLVHGKPAAVTAPCGDAPSAAAGNRIPAVVRAINQLTVENQPLRRAHPGGRGIPHSRPGARPPQDRGRHQVTLAVVNVTTIGLVT